MLKISNLSFSYGSETILDRLSLNLPGRGLVAIIGDNGTGKTTLLRLIAGQLTPDDGSIRLTGRVGYLSQDHHDDTLSGGEVVRAKLRELFEAHYDCLLLDEPTNNLDAQARRWLVDELRRFNGLAIIVSHDRRFIDAVASSLVVIKAGKAKLYGGNYRDYQERVKQAEAEQWEEYAKAKLERKRLNKRMVAAKSRAHSADNSHFDKLKHEDKGAFKNAKSGKQSRAGKEIRAVKTRLDQLAGIEKPTIHKVYRVNFTADQLRDRRLLLVENLTKSYQRKLFRDISFTVRTGERVRIVGDNGTGKTTLLRIIIGQLAPDSGTVKITTGVRYGYVAQGVYGLDLGRNLLSQADAEASEIYQAASTMDLSPTAVAVPLNQLSRGQLTKMAVLKLILDRLDLIILDELTNHLDIRARENIERALAEYPGAIIYATHDEVLAQTLGVDKQVALSTSG